MLICFFVKRNYIFRDYESGETVKDDFLQLSRLQVRNQLGKVIVSQELCYLYVSLSAHIHGKLDIGFDLRIVRVKE